MNKPSKISNERISKKNAFILVGFTILIIFGGFVFVQSRIETTREINIFRDEAPITKVEMKVVSEKGVNYVTITDKIHLDSINSACQKAVEKDISQGGVFDTSADISIYKKGKKIDLEILYSPYNGWMIDIGNKSLTSEYLFELVRRNTIQHRIDSSSKNR